MNAARRFCRKAREIGICGAVKLSVKRILRRAVSMKEYEDKIKLLQEEIDVLHLYLNNIADIKNFPQANGALRELQLCNTELMSIICSMCEKYEWDYWLSFGTLLGAVRHKGFIPWDDDVDICMPRKDYCELTEKLPDILPSSSVEILYSDPLTTVMGYKNSKTRIQCDIFPVDIVSCSGSDEADNWEALRKRVSLYQNFMRQNTLSVEELNTARNTYLDCVNCGEGGGH